MHFIAHRGNVYGKNIERENTISYILEAINEGFECEIDVWFDNNCLFLGHDCPQYDVSHEFLQEHASQLWIHCKNLGALMYMRMNGVDFNYFFHHNDEYTLTSKCNIWGNIDSKLDKGIICVMPECFTRLDEDAMKRCDGICSDIIGDIKLDRNIEKRTV